MKNFLSERSGEHLDSIFNEASRDLRVVLVSGFSGVGKTTIVRNFLKGVTDKARIYKTHLSEDRSANKFDGLAPFTRMVRKRQNYKKLFARLVNLIFAIQLIDVESIVDIIKTGAPKKGRTMRLVSFLRERLGLADPQIHDYYNIIARLASAGKNPFVLYIDNAQLMDKASIEVLQKLVNQAENIRGMIILEYTLTEDRYARREYSALMRSSERTKTIFVPPMNQNEMEQLIVGLLGKDFLNNSEMLQLIKLVNGNPYALKTRIEHWQKNLVVKSVQPGRSLKRTNRFSKENLWARKCGM